MDHIEGRDEGVMSDDDGNCGQAQVSWALDGARCR